MNISVSIEKEKEPGTFKVSEMPLNTLGKIISGKYEGHIIIKAKNVLYDDPSYLVNLSLDPLRLNGSAWCSDCYDQIVEILPNSKKVIIEMSNNG